MAGPSPSPSGSSRRLSELLDQQQEPFSLDLYLLEKGCSPALLDAAAGDSGACSTCWPMTRRSGRTLMRQAGSTEGSCASGVLRLLLCKILRGTTAAATAKKQRPQPVAIDWRRGDGEKQGASGRCKNSVPLHGDVEANTEKAGLEEEEADEDDDSKRLSGQSPVSVLEQRPLEHSPPAHEQKALLIFRELLQAAYTPALLGLLAKAKGTITCGTSKDARCTITSKATTTLAPVRNNNVHWEDIFEQHHARATSLIASEMAGERAWPGDAWPELQDVGADIAAAVLEALVEEAAAELIETGHDFAVEG